MTITQIGVKVLVVVSLVVGTVAAGKAYHAHVYGQGYTAAVELRKGQDAIKKAQDTETARKDEAALAETKRLEQLARKKENQDHEDKIAVLESRVRTGAVSLRIATAAIRAGSPGSNPGPVVGPASEEGTDLLPETSIAFIRIAAGSARDVRDYNTLMVEYERARALCNKGSTPQ